DEAVRRPDRREVGGQPPAGPRWPAGRRRRQRPGRRDPAPLLRGAVVKYAVFLRGVNVGGRGELAMADLRDALEAAGFGDVATYLQSGNAVVGVPGRSSAAKVEDRVRAAIVTALGASPELVVRTHAELVALIDGNPYPAAADEKPAWLHLFF